MAYVKNDAGQCCGCTACVNICPKNAISMRQDKRGFYDPVIREEQCIHCDLCQTVCDFTKFSPVKDKAVFSYAARHKEEAEVATSRSGGFFSALAESVIDQQGVCYGAVLAQDLSVVHKRAQTKEECAAFKGSKYVQSFIPEDLYRQCKADLTAGKTVLFSGTGCQVHGLLRYLDTSKVDRTNLITVDFVCHGVPSPGVWKDYIAETEKRSGKKIAHVNFRDKNKFGWVAHKETYTFTDGSEFSSSGWADVFYQHCLFRESCYHCPYTTPYRESDFTIGDYWGFEKVVDGYRDNKGLSLVIVQNERAKKLLADLDSLLDTQATDLAQSLQAQLKKPAYKGIEYGRFWKLHEKKPEKAVKKYFFPSRSRIGFMKFIAWLKKIVKSVLKMLKK